jgi:hypothetical protein
VKRETLKQVSFVVALLGFVSYSCLAAGFEHEALFLETSEIGTTDGMAGPVTTQQVLLDGEEYCIMVTGTMSLWHWSAWGLHCGAAENAPMYPSPDVQNGGVGADAEVWFADGTGMCDRIGHHSEFKMDFGTGFAHMEPTDGQMSIPGVGHVYMYGATGQGTAASFGYSDVYTEDNYGRFLITVSRWEQSCTVSAGPSDWSGIKSLFR